MSKVYLIEVSDSDLEAHYLLRYVFKERADAEEFALSLVDEKAYDTFVRTVYNQGFTLEQYFSYMKEFTEYTRIKTVECNLYLCSGYGYKVIEGELL